MNSICIKTNNNKIINYLLNELENFKLKDVYFSYKFFSKYNNIIIHYKGENSELFYTKLSTVLSYLVIDFFEKNIIKRILHTEFFYFSNFEINEIIKIFYNLIEPSEDFNFQNRKLILFNIFYNYVTVNKNLYLSGFITFKTKSYINVLNELIDTSVNKFIIEKEYNEFISILKYYISSQFSKTKIIHIVHYYDKFVILDENQNPIDTNIYTLNNKYISDISFSDNDYILNALLELIPEKIIVHTELNFYDEFLNTLKLIFENRIIFCSDNTLFKELLENI